MPSFINDPTQSPSENLDRVALALRGVPSPVLLSGSSLGSGKDGQLAYYEADNTNGVWWAFRYDADSDKWHFVGGPPLFGEVSTGQTSTSTSYADLTTAGPSVTVPLAGDYLVSLAAELIPAASANAGAFASPKFGSGTAADGDSIVAQTPSAGVLVAHCARSYVRTGLTAGEVVKLQYRVSSGTGTFGRRTLQLQPIRVT